MSVICLFSALLIVFPVVCVAETYRIAIVGDFGSGSVSSAADDNYSAR